MKILSYCLNSQQPSVMPIVRYKALQPVVVPPAAATPPVAAVAALPGPAEDRAPWLASIVLVLVLPALAGGLLWRHARRARQSRLSEREREAALQQVRAWMLEAPPAAVGSVAAPLRSPQ